MLCWQLVVIQTYSYSQSQNSNDCVQYPTLVHEPVGKVVCKALTQTGNQNHLGFFWYLLVPNLALS